MKFIVTKSYEEMSRKGADLIGAQVLVKPNCLLGLATGSTPIGLYAELVRRNQEGSLDFSKVRSVNLDEYCGLSPESDQSYHYFMNYHLFSKVNIPFENTRVPNGLAEDLAQEGLAYDAYIAQQGGIDLQLLGIGHNGHIGFNEPDDVFTAATHCVDLTESTITANARLFASIDEVPTKAITMGMRSIMAAKKILLVANGLGKQEIVKQAFFGPVTPKCPASLLQLHPDVTVITDFDVE